MREAKILGLINKKNKKIDPNITIEIITQLSMLPLEYIGDFDYLKIKLEIISKQYPNNYNGIYDYFIDNKFKYFQNNSYNYCLFPKDIRSNSILERYNKTIKEELGEKRTCNWVVFLNFITKELDRITLKLSKNENVNVLYSMKHSKFGLDKFVNKNNNNIGNKFIIENEERNKNISEKWLIQKGNNCRYNAFITLMYFTITPYINNLKDETLILLNKLNDLILNLSENINDKN